MRFRGLLIFFQKPFCMPSAVQGACPFLHELHRSVDGRNARSCSCACSNIVEIETPRSDFQLLVLCHDLASSICPSACAKCSNPLLCFLSFSLSLRRKVLVQVPAALQMQIIAVLWIQQSRALLQPSGLLSLWAWRFCFGGYFPLQSQPLFLLSDFIVAHHRCVAKSQFLCSHPPL